MSDDHWFQNPTKKQVIICTVLWLTGLLLLLLAITDLFREFYFNIPVFLLLGGSTFSVIKLYNNYRSAEHSSYGQQ